MILCLTGIPYDRIATYSCIYVPIYAMMVIYVYYITVFYGASAIRILQSAFLERLAPSDWRCWTSSLFCR